VASELVDAHPDGVIFVDLAPVRDERLVPATVAQALDMHEAAGRSARELPPRSPPNSGHPSRSPQLHFVNQYDKSSLLLEALSKYDGLAKQRVESIRGEMLQLIRHVLIAVGGHADVAVAHHLHDDAIGTGALTNLPLSSRPAVA
jgi:hypothetical protein